MTRRNSGERGMFSNSQNQRSNSNEGEFEVESEETEESSHGSGANCNQRMTLHHPSHHHPNHHSTSSLYATHAHQQHHNQHHAHPNHYSPSSMLPPPPPPPPHPYWNNHHSSSNHSASAEALMLTNARLNYLRNSRSIGVLWAVFSACFSIINIIVFVQPQWLGDTESSRGTGYFGLFKSCRLLQDGQDLICSGSLFGASSSSSSSTSNSAPVISAFKAATLFVGGSVVASLSTLASFPLFFMMHSSTVFHICGWLQTVNALLLTAGLLTFPLGWDAPAIREVCGPGADIYAPGDCSVRWTLILGAIGAVDVSVLALLSFLLGSRYVKLLEPKYLARAKLPSGGPSHLVLAPSSVKGGGGSSSLGLVNGAFNVTTDPPPVTLLGAMNDHEESRRASRLAPKGGSQMMQSL